MRKAFVSSYRGESEYVMQDGPDRGKHVRVRTFAANDGHWTNWPEIRAQIGTVRFKYESNGAFPSAETMAAFPGYIAARYVGHHETGLTIEYANHTEPCCRLSHRGWIEVTL